MVKVPATGGAGFISGSLFLNTCEPNQSPDFVMSKFISPALINNDITVYGDGLQSTTSYYIDDNIGTGAVQLPSPDICKKPAKEHDDTITKSI